jgi:hypothetical protein
VNRTVRKNAHAHAGRRSGRGSSRMSGRRRHDRFEVSVPWNGRLAVFRDVLVQPDADGALTAISQTPIAVDDVLTLDITGGGGVATLRVQVVASRPVTHAGSVRHAARLSVLECIRRVTTTG